MALWFDVDDLIRYFCYNARPTGIQRLSLAVFAELHRHAEAGEAIFFCRRQPYPPFFRQIDFADLQVRLASLVETPMTLPVLSPPEPDLPVVPASRPGRLSQMLRALPERYRRPLYAIIGALRDIRGAVRDLIWPPYQPQKLETVRQFDLVCPPVAFSPGDWLINLGSSWNAPLKPAALRELKAGGVRFALLVHDLIPELFPEWSAADTLAEFRAWFAEIVPAAELIFANSNNTAADIRRCLSAMGAVVPPVVTLPMGVLNRTEEIASPMIAARPFVLMVSTIEVRKNHAMMFRVWQKLLKLGPVEMVPDLVFAGKPGWLTADFLQQLENAGWLDGKIRWVESPSDAELAALYRECLFTVYPSLYEGWGLPVSESLGFGKTVAASNRASIPEAGGEFCVYFDPENIDEATEVIGGLIRHPAQLASLEQLIAQNYRAPDWAETAGAMLRAIAEMAIPKLSEAAIVLDQAA